MLEKHTEYVKRYIQTGHESDHNAVACILALDSVSPAVSDGKVDVPSVGFLLNHINLYREKLKTAQDLWNYASCGLVENRALPVTVCKKLRTLIGRTHKTMLSEGHVRIRDGDFLIAIIIP